MKRTLTPSEVEQARLWYWNDGVGRREIARRLGVCTETISRIVRGDTHRRVAMADEHVMQANPTTLPSEDEVARAEAELLAMQAQPNKETELVSDEARERAKKYGAR